MVEENESNATYFQPAKGAATGPKIRLTIDSRLQGDA